MRSCILDPSARRLNYLRIESGSKKYKSIYGMSLSVMRINSVLSVLNLEIISKKEEFTKRDLMLAENPTPGVAIVTSASVSEA